MSSSKTDETIINLGRKWRRNPEPNKVERDPHVILDADGPAEPYLYDCMDQDTRWIKYTGELIEIEN